LPPEQICVEPQGASQAPQFVESLDKSTHAPWQMVCEVVQATAPPVAVTEPPVAVVPPAGAEVTVLEVPPVVVPPPAPPTCVAGGGNGLELVAHPYSPNNAPQTKKVPKVVDKSACRIAFKLLRFLG